MVKYMIIRLGYVALSKTLDITSSKTISYTNYLKIENKQEKDKKIDEIIVSNLNSLSELIDYNIKNNIHFFRLTSNLIPLATLKDVKFEYIKCYQNLYQKIGNKIKANNMRVDFHPDQFTVLNSTKSEVVQNTIDILNYHYSLLKALNVENKIIILHIGSSVLGKKNSIQRFINNFNKLPNYLKSSIVLENDDKTYNIKDTLELCQTLNIPMVLDYHHYVCNKDNLDISKYYDSIFKTWTKTNPKMHFSSPKSKLKKEIRSHHDYIDCDQFISFLESIKNLNYNIDIMIEAKAKDEALFRLIRQLKYKTNYHFIDETSFEI